jgi:hypothetical protein
MGWKKKLLLDATVAVTVWVATALCWFFLYWFLLWYAKAPSLGEWDWHDLRWLFLAPVMPAILFFGLCQDFVCRPGIATGLLIAGLGLLPVAFAAQFRDRRGWIWTVLGAASVAIWWGFGTSYAIVMAALSHWAGD